MRKAIEFNMLLSVFVGVCVCALQNGYPTLTSGVYEFDAFQFCE